MMLLTPGVHLESKGDGLGQQYVTVDEAFEGESDAIIVGRGIYGSGEPGKHPRIYREKAWLAYEKNNL